MPQEKKKSSEALKVTDKRIFTADGDIKEEFRESVQPSDPPPRQTEPAKAPEPASTPPADKSEHSAQPQSGTVKGAPQENPDTPFSNFVYTLAIQAFASLGMVRGMPMQPDPEGAR